MLASGMGLNEVMYLEMNCSGLRFSDPQEWN